MSNRSYPADFWRPLRETPVLDEAEWFAMMERLRRRCEVGKISVNGSGIAQSLAEHGVDTSRFPGADPGAVASNLAPASSADTPTSAGGLHVSATADKTTCAGGESNGAEHTANSPFQPTRPASINGSSSSGPVRDVHDSGGLGDVQTNEGADPSCSPPLQWERINPTAMCTTCGTWTCCKVTVMGKVTYELWRRIAGLERPVRVTEPFDRFEQAKQAAQDEMDRVD